MEMFFVGEEKRFCRIVCRIQKFESESDLDFFEDDVINSGQLLPDLFISGGVKEKDASTEDSIEDGEGTVEGNILNNF
jgi:hypothetical protein